jgi:hypothetical protein
MIDFSMFNGLAQLAREANATSEFVRQHQRQIDDISKLAQVPHAVRAFDVAQTLRDELMRSSDALSRIPNAAAMVGKHLTAAGAVQDMLAANSAVAMTLQKMQAPQLDGVSRFLEDMNAARTRMSEMWSSLIAPIRQIEETFAPFANLIAEHAYWALRHDDRRIARLLVPRGWLGMERHLDLSELDRLLKIRGARRGEAIDKRICSLFRSRRYKRIGTMSRAWWSVPYLRERRPIIRQALGAHKKRKWALSISTLLPLVDGLAAEIRKANPKLTVVTAKNGKPRLIAVADVVTLYDPAGRAPEWGTMVVSTVCGSMFKSYDFDSQPAPAKINRHGVLHGRITKYHTEANSLKIILLLDVMAHIAACEQRNAA